MALNPNIDSVSTRKPRAIVRRMTVGGKFTATEHEALARIAASKGQLLSEWVRELLLREIVGEKRDLDLICEFVGLQLLLMNVLAPMARGEKISAEQFQSIVRSVQTTKAKAAEEMLYRRRLVKEL